jgi:TPR repeat protein
MNACDESTRRLAEKGNAAAQNSLARGFQLEGNYESAVPWFEKAANQGDREAMYEVASIYARGNFIKNEGAADLLIDADKAVYWYRKAAELGSKEAMLAIGGMYQEGRLVAQNYQEAMKWYQKAAEAGDPLGSHSLAIMFERGLGVERDNVRAYMWYSIACADGGRFEHNVGNFSCVVRDIVAHQMSPAYVSRAQEMASDWEKIYRK